MGCQEVKRCDGDHDIEDHSDDDDIMCNSHSVHGANEEPGFGTLWSTLGRATLPGARHPQPLR